MNSAIVEHFGLDCNKQTYDFAIIGEARSRGMEHNPDTGFDDMVQEAEAYLTKLTEEQHEKEI